MDVAICIAVLDAIYGVVMALGMTNKYYQVSRDDQARDDERDGNDAA